MSHVCLQANSEIKNAADRAIAFIRNSQDYNLILPCTNKREKFKLELFTDASHRTEFSVGWLLLMNGNIIDSGSKLIKETYNNSTMCELVAIKHGVQRLDYIMNLLTSLDLTPHTRPIIHTDNMGAIHFIIKNNSTKGLAHINYNFHLLKHHIRDNYILQHIPGTSNPANIFTKAVSQNETQNFFDKFYSKS